MDIAPRSRASSPDKESPCRSWLQKAYAELMATRRIVQLYPKTTLLAPLLLLSFILVLGIWGVTYASKTEQNSARDRASILALDASVWLQQLLYNAISPVMLTAAMVAYNPNITDVKSLFNGLAPVMHAQAPPGSIRVLQLVPHGVVSASYPLAGNEGALGLDLFGSDSNRDGAVKTVSDRILTLVGPINFVQGGRGFIVRQPIFVSNVTEEETFGIPHPINDRCGPACAYNATSRTQLWGFASALVNLDALVHANRSKLQSLSDLGYFYQLRVEGEQGGSSQLIAASDIPPRNPVEVVINLPNAKWVLMLAPDHGWSSRWFGGLLASVIVLAVATAVLLFAALVSWRRHQLLLEALLPKKILQDLRIEDAASPFNMCPAIHQAETPADLLLNMMGDILEGYPPNLPDVVFIRTALIRNLDLYTPLDVRSQIKAADLDSEVAQALMQQLVGGAISAANADVVNLKAMPGAAVTTRSYDIDTLSGALAFVLSPEAVLPDPPPADTHTYNTSYSAASAAFMATAAAVAATSSGGGGDGGGGGQGTIAASLSHLNSSPLLVRRAPILVSNPGMPTASLAEVATAPTLGCCVDDLCAEDEDGGATAAATDGPAVATYSPTTPPFGSQQPQTPVSFVCVPNKTASHSLVRSSGGFEDCLRAPPHASSPGLHHGFMHSFQTMHRIRPSVTAAGGGAVCGACGAPVPLLPLDAAAALAATTPNWSFGSASGGGGSTTRLLAAARKLRGVGNSAAERCAAQQGSISVSGAISAGGGGGGGSGGLRPGSRLGSALSTRMDRPLSHSSVAGNPNLVTLHPPMSLGKAPSVFGEATATRSGAAAPGGAPAAAGRGDGDLRPTSVLDVRRSRTTEDIDLQVVREVPRSAEVAPEGDEEEAAAAAAVGIGAPASGIEGPRPPAPLLQEVERVLASTDSWFFDAWELKAASGDHALSALGFYLIQREGLLARFQMKPVVLARLLRRVEAGYHDNPYHNSTHAADVLQSLHVLIHGAQLHVHYLDPLGLLAAYFAAIIHDYGHPGLTGDFLIASSHPLALRYNDRSPLENHHCAAAFSLMRKPELDAMAPLSLTERSAFRKLVIDLVLGTDMKQHLPILSHFNTVHRLAAYSQQKEQQQQQQQQPSTAHPSPAAHLVRQRSGEVGNGRGEAGSGRAVAGGNGGPVGSGTLAAGPSGTGSLARHVSANSNVLSAGAASNGTGNGNGNSNGTPGLTGGTDAVNGTGTGAAAATATAGPTATATATATAPRPIDDTERVLSLQLAVKCADIGNLGRELECYKRWVDVLEEEFFRQGDKERELGLPISPLCDRTKLGVSKSQAGFFDFVALPLVHAMAAAFPGASPLLRAFLSNYNHWKRLSAAASNPSGSSASHPAPPPPLPTHPQQQQQSAGSRPVSANGMQPPSNQISPRTSGAQLQAGMASMPRSISLPRRNSHTPLSV